MAATTRPIEKLKIAILDDYQDIAHRTSADWSPLQERCTIESFASTSPIAIR